MCDDTVVRQARPAPHTSSPLPPQIAVDVIAMGENEGNGARLGALVEAANSGGNSRLLVVPAGVMPSDVLSGHAILLGEDAHGGGGAAGGAAAGGACVPGRGHLRHPLLALTPRFLDASCLQGAEAVAAALQSSGVSTLRWTPSSPWPCGSAWRRRGRRRATSRRPLRWPRQVAALRRVLPLLRWTCPKRSCFCSRCVTSPPPTRS